MNKALFITIEQRYVFGAGSILQNLKWNRSRNAIGHLGHQALKTAKIRDFR